MKAYAIGLLLGGALLLPVAPAVAAPASQWSPSSPSPAPNDPPLIIWPVTGGGGEHSPEPVPSDLSPEPEPEPSEPEWVGPSARSPLPSASPSESAPTPSQRPGPGPVARSEQVAPARTVLPLPGPTWVPAARDRDRPGNHDLYADGEE
ncbi:hypothetical protein GL263_26600, partial [Streptomyces durbertensis]|nr:hypothetical protein [Streptomyces durbertensis]